MLNRFVLVALFACLTCDDWLISNPAHSECVRQRKNNESNLAPILALIGESLLVLHWKFNAGFISFCDLIGAKYGLVAVCTGILFVWH